MKDDTYFIYRQPGKEDLPQSERTAGLRTAVPEWIARFASAEDCPALILRFAPEVLSAVLTEQKELTLGFRGSAELSSACYEWKIVRGDDFVGTGEIWFLLKTSSEDAALLQKYRHRAEDLGNIVVGMADYYDSIGIFDLYTQKEEQYRQSRLFNEQIPDWNTTDLYTERMQMFCDTLVIDDDMLSCTSAASMLRQLGIRSEWCQSASEALTLIENAQSTGDRFELFLVDWVMNEMDGSEVVQRIRKISNEPAPIIIQTAYDRLSIADDLASLSVDGFVSKPLFPSDLYNVLSGCAKPVPESEETAEADDFTGKSVLLVEDNEMNREIAEDILMEYGLTVDSAEDGLVAVEKVRDMSPGKYDMIIMDIQMPVMDGYEATRQIRKLENQAAAALPIVAMTANAFQEDREAAFAAGMNDHLAKPIDIDLLEKVLEKYLSR